MADIMQARLKACPPYSPYPAKGKNKANAAVEQQQSQLGDVKAEIEGIRRTRQCFEENLAMVLQNRHEFDIQIEDHTQLDK